MKAAKTAAKGPIRGWCGAEFDCFKNMDAGERFSMSSGLLRILIMTANSQKSRIIPKNPVAGRESKSSGNLKIVFRLRFWRLYCALSRDVEFAGRDLTSPNHMV
jgi:hypothetical protein